jgi:very-short-patch-repair endonuclease
MKQAIIPYRPGLKAYARKLRRKMTLAEVLLWQRLKGKQLCGYDFDRQRPLGRRIVDFYCKELQLAVDADGSVHDHSREKDDSRQREIEALGVTLLRFWNHDLKTNMVGVLERIEIWIRAEEKRRGWLRREPPMVVPRRRATRNGQSRENLNKALLLYSKADGETAGPTPNPSSEGNTNWALVNKRPAAVKSSSNNNPLFGGARGGFTTNPDATK